MNCGWTWIWLYLILPFGYNCSGDSIAQNSSEQDRKEYKIVSDSITIDLVDSLYNQAVYRMSVQHYNHLESLCEESDGSISEYIRSKLGNLFYETPCEILTLLHNTRNSCLESALIDEWGMIISVSSSDSDYITMSAKKCTEVHLKKYFQKIFSEVNPEKWD